MAKGSAAKRAWRSLGKSVRKEYRRRGAAMGKSRKETIQSFGSATRKSRIRSGVNPNTGRTYTAGQLGLQGGARKQYRRASQSIKRAYARAGARRNASGGMRRGGSYAGGTAGVRRGTQALMGSPRVGRQKKRRR